MKRNPGVCKTCRFYSTRFKFSTSECQHMKFPSCKEHCTKKEQNDDGLRCPSVCLIRLSSVPESKCPFLCEQTVSQT